MNNYWGSLEEYENPSRWIESAIRTQSNQFSKDLKDILAYILQNYSPKNLL